MTTPEEERIKALQTYTLMVRANLEEKPDLIRISTTSKKSQRATIYLTQHEARSLIDLLSRTLENPQFAGVTMIRNSAEVEFDPRANIRFFGMN